MAFDVSKTLMLEKQYLYVKASKGFQLEGVSTERIWTNTGYYRFLVDNVARALSNSYIKILYDSTDTEFVAYCSDLFLEEIQSTIVVAVENLESYLQQFAEDNHTDIMSTKDSLDSLSSGLSASQQAILTAIVGLMGSVGSSSTLDAIKNAVGLIRGSSSNYMKDLYDIYHFLDVNFERLLFTGTSRASIFDVYNGVINLKGSGDNIKTLFDIWRAISTFESNLTVNNAISLNDIKYALENVVGGSGSSTGASIYDLLRRQIFHDLNDLAYSTRYSSVLVLRSPQVGNVDIRSLISSDSGELSFCVQVPSDTVISAGTEFSIYFRISSNDDALNYVYNCKYKHYLIHGVSGWFLRVVYKNDFEVQVGDSYYDTFKLTYSKALT